jgi:hypothetical protein
MKISNRFKIEYNETQSQSCGDLTKINNVVFQQKKIFKSNSLNQLHLHLVKQKYLNLKRKQLMLQKQKSKDIMSLDQEQDQEQEQEQEQEQDQDQEQEHEQEHEQEQDDLFYNSYLINSEYDNKLIELPIIYLEDEINQSWCKIINNINSENEEKFNNYLDTDIFVQDKIL